MHEPSKELIVGILLASVFAASVAITSPAKSASDRYYPDIARASANGRYALTATSPANALTPPFPFASDFTYTLRDVQNGNATLWTFRINELGESPVDAWIHDSGWTVIRDSDDEIHVHEVKAGKLIGTVNLIRRFRNSDATRKYIHHTSIGPLWDSSSRWSFLEHDAELYFVVRPHWGERTVVRLRDAEVVADEGTLHEATTAADLAWMNEQLADAVHFYASDVQASRDYPAIRSANTAIHMTWRLNASDSVPLLRELEKSTYVGRSTSTSCDGVHDGVDIGSWLSLSTRAKAQNALRRLGEVPADLPATRFRNAPGRDETIATASRADRLKMVTQSMPVSRVLALIGAPDDISSMSDSYTWEYHVGTADGYTMQFHITAQPNFVVSRIEQITPPTWTQSDDIDR